jgi:uncharacterized membrane protein YhaH (DUF805 family)
MQPEEKKYWFRAKRYGYGWGLPCSWQGWVVFGVWLALMGAGAFLMPEHPLVFGAHVLILVAALIVICIFKGEPPRWRWGKD